MRPILLLLYSTNQTLPSGPVLIASDPLLAVRIGNTPVITPAVVIRPIVLVLNSVNQMLPSGPEEMPTRLLPALTGNSVMWLLCVYLAAVLCNQQEIQQTVTSAVQRTPDPDGLRRFAAWVQEHLCPEDISWLFTGQMVVTHAGRAGWQCQPTPQHSSPKFYFTKRL